MPSDGAHPQPPDAGRGNPLPWLILGILAALSPAVGLEAVLDQRPELWTEAVSPFDINTDTRRALYMEAQLRAAATQPAPEVLLLGNSIMSNNIDADELQSCCGPVEKIVTSGLTLLEAAMLSQWVTRIKPKLLVMAITEPDIYRSAGWNDLRFYDPEVAMSLTTRMDFIKNSDAHIRGLVQQRFTLFRHRHALLELCGTATHLPFREMLEVVPDECVVYSDIEPVALPSPQTEALSHLAVQLQHEGIGLLVFSSPTRAGKTRPDAALQQRIETADAHLDQLARTHGFRFVPAGMLGRIDQDAYKDTLHMMPAGSAQLTEKLAPYVQAALAQHRQE